MSGLSPERPDTGSRILDVAERLVQTRGFNGFSYADVAAELSLTKAGLHHHFPSKAGLGKALVDRYTSRFVSALAEVNLGCADAVARLRAYADLYAGVLRKDRMCLCGVLAAEYETLPEPMRLAVTRFLEVNEAWLERVLDEGEAAAEVSFDGSARDAARLVVAGLEGAMLVAHAFGDTARFEAAATGIIDGLVRPPLPTRAG
ncbi:MAG: TetR/AcrR family transcriptional regulator [Acidimicrobiia bacterium]|nr:TetR/AcrR family transcriptional regulator [Acidimicrobiia bacterium]